MPIRRAAAEAGVIGPEDLELLRRVFDATGVEDETEVARENRAAQIVQLFAIGVRDEAALISRMQHV